MEFISNNEEETFEFSKKVLDSLKKGDVLVLSGDLGAGKTTFTKCLAKAMNISEHITSPTFTLVNEYYSGIYPLYHFDMYRIEDESEMQELGFGEYLNGGAEKQSGLVVIEWAENIPNYLPTHYKKLTITKLSDTSRKFELSEI